MSQYWILDADHRTVPTDMMTWGRFFDDIDKRRVAETITEHHRVSTVFLGLDHQWGKGPPILFETMVFAKDGKKSDLDSSMDRYASWDDAETGHKVTVRRVLKYERDGL